MIDGDLSKAASLVYLDVLLRWNEVSSSPGKDDQENARRLWWLTEALERQYPEACRGVLKVFANGGTADLRREGADATGLGARPGPSSGRGMGVPPN